MKRIILSVSCLIASSMAFAGGGSIKKISANEDGRLSNGFYLNLGASFWNTKITEAVSSSILSPSILAYDISKAKSQSLGVMPSLELGNQWYFYNTDSWGVGLKASWLHFGFSSITNAYYTNATGNAYNIQLLKLAPQFTYAINEDMAVDVAFEGGYTFLLQTFKEADGVVGGPIVGTRRDDVANFSMGILYSPSVRFRYKVFALGYDYSFGTLGGTQTMPDGYSDSEAIVQKISGSRITLGFQF